MWCCLIMKRVLKVLGYVLLTAYFVADLVFAAIARPLTAWMERSRILRRVNAWIAGLREGLNGAVSDKDPHDPLHYSVTRRAMRQVTEVARERIRRFRASGHAPALRQLLLQSETPGA